MGAKTPAVPEPTPAVVPAAIPDPPTKASADVQGARGAARNRGLAAAGTTSTLLTGASGLSTTATNAPKSLLGQ
ncbi:hypothetical protein M0638_27405 [Roseomonas sp. NAR14]|uniref:Uncharacterized protein n=1 Tax=Roseomonas acroporae TaxID=2937791 RepID=A0A9X1YDD7_9PROT|nr:hypothetical protein [Roseomonas acroporae]MCK8788088.1 hypothetical protein [Roseomonas acroporae]